MDIRSEFEEIISRKGCPESDVQEFLEQNPIFLFTPFLLNHGLHLDVLISKAKLNSVYVTDFAYLTKSSVSWNIVLVELESPSKKLFNVNGGRLTRTSEFNKAIEQIDTWRAYVKKNPESVKKIFRPLLGVMEENPVNFKYCLVIGRRDCEDQKMFAERMDLLCTDDMHVCTYDSLLSYFDSSDSRLKSNIISHVGEKFTFKYLHSYPFNLFSVLGPDRFVLDAKFDEMLKAEGFDIESWRGGQRLLINGKRALDSPTFVRPIRKNVK